MSNEILSVKKKGNVFKAKIFKRTSGKKHGEVIYQNVLDIKDYKALAILFKDWEVQFNAPIEKAVREMKKNKFSYW